MHVVKDNNLSILAYPLHSHAVSFFSIVFLWLAMHKPALLVTSGIFSETDLFYQILPYWKYHFRAKWKNKRIRSEALHILSSSKSFSTTIKKVMESALCSKLVQVACLAITTKYNIQVALFDNLAQIQSLSNSARGSSNTMVLFQWNNGKYHLWDAIVSLNKHTTCTNAQVLHYLAVIKQTLSYLFLI